LGEQPYHNTITNKVDLIKKVIESNFSLGMAEYDGRVENENTNLLPLLLVDTLMMASSRIYKPCLNV
jgi:hypothetical protein